MTSEPEITVLLPDERETSALRDAMTAEVEAMGSRRSRLSFRSRRGRGPSRLAVILVTLCTVGIGAGLAGAAGVFSAEEMEVEAGIGCYSEATLTPKSTTIIGPRQDPIAACAELWRQGVVKPGSKGMVPPLVACTGVDQPVRVMPGKDASVCARLDLVPLPADYADASAATERLQLALKSLGKGEYPGASGPACKSPVGAVDQAVAKLERGGFTGIPISIEGDRPCAGHFDVEDDGLNLITATEAQIQIWQLGGRLDRLLKSTVGSASAVAGRRCVDPQVVAAKAERRLAEQGLGEVEVMIEGRGPCMDPSWGSDPEGKRVIVSTRDRRSGSHE